MGIFGIRLKLLFLISGLALVPATPVDAAPSALRVTTLTHAVRGRFQTALPFAARNVALYWRGHPDARVTVAFSRDGVHFAEPVEVGRDDVAAQRHNGITYGTMLTTHNATAVRVRASEVIQKLTVLGLRDRIRDLVAPVVPAPPSQHAPMPRVIARADWGADESLRFRADGTEKWTPTFEPLTKLIVHHTDTSNDDRNPAATVRAIYYYHAISQDWGDIGYNFLVDQQGRVYKGRASHPTGSKADTLNGQDAQGRGVTGAHALANNRGTVGVALLGTLTDRDATPAAREALERLLAWEADAHDIDPHGASPYTTSTGAQLSYPNIAGHRDTGRQTACPGEAFYRTLPQLRNGVAARMG